MEEENRHFELVVDAVRQGMVVPFLGAGVNLCDRQPGTCWTPKSNDYLPSGLELAEALAAMVPDSNSRFCTVPGCPRPAPDLMRVSQNVVTFLDEGRLYKELREIFGVKAPPTSLHRFLASLASLSNQNARSENRYPLIVTTNYDDLMESAFRERNQKFDLVFYHPDDGPGGKFWHINPTGERRRIAEPAIEDPHLWEERPVVLKIHGTIDPLGQEHEGFVITEDHYIEYLAEGVLEKLLPKPLLARLQDNHLLFLGYGLRDWDFRVSLCRLKKNPKHKYRSWAVVLSVDQAEYEFWHRNGVDIIAMRLEEYIARLKRSLQPRPIAQGKESGNGRSV